MLALLVRCRHISPDKQTATARFLHVQKQDRHICHLDWRRLRMPLKRRGCIAVEHRMPLRLGALASGLWCTPMVKRMLPGAGMACAKVETAKAGLSNKSSLGKSSADGTSLGPGADGTCAGKSVACHGARAVVLWSDPDLLCKACC